MSLFVVVVGSQLIVEFVFCGYCFAWGVDSWWGLFTNCACYEIGLDDLLCGG